MSRIQNIVNQIKANREVSKAKEALKPINIAKGAAKGIAKDIVKLTTGLGKGGAATEMVKNGMRKIGTSTGYMVKRVGQKAADFMNKSGSLGDNTYEGMKKMREMAPKMKKIIK